MMKHTRYELKFENVQGGIDDYGYVTLSENPFHRTNMSVDFSHAVLDLAMARTIADELVLRFGRKLQVSIGSEDTSTIDFLLAGGFNLCRVCYVREFSADDVADCYPENGCAGCITGYASRGEWIYQKAAEQLYQDYRSKHESINPLTVELPEFLTAVPELVFYSLDGQNLKSYAFLEKNEIAYVGTRDPACFRDFLHLLLADLFAKYERVSIEADDVDADAMVLKRLFRDSDTHTYHTYIK